MPKFLKQHGLFILILILSLPIKLAAAQNMPWDVDIVPVVSRNVEYLIPPVGTLIECCRVQYADAGMVAPPRPMAYR